MQFTNSLFYELLKLNINIVMTILIIKIKNLSEYNDLSSF